MLRIVAYFLKRVEGVIIRTKHKHNITHVYIHRVGEDREVVKLEVEKCLL